MDWSDVEEAFFAAAPPDEPEPPRFDELVALPPPRRPLPAPLRKVWAEVRRGFDAVMSQIPDGHTFWVVLVTVLFVIGLSAAVFASRSGGHGAPGSRTNATAPQRSP